MEKKELAYQYVYDYLFKDAKIGKVAEKDPLFSVEDRTELKNVLETLDQLTSNARNFVVQQQDEVVSQKRMALANMENTNQTIMSMKSSLQDVIRDAKTAYKFVLWMYVMAFFLGIALIVVAVVFAVQGKMILSIAFGTIGLIDIVTHFIFKPPLELQSSRSNLTQLMIVVTNWFADLMNLNAFMAQKGADITLEEINQISDKLNSNTAKSLDLIERYSEPTGKNNQVKG
ncbi:MAG: hypothetical protein RBS07_10000 [Lentimicrobium sp.]|jgi:hypothetical protein|nr:hypothetical protein [Lentimicrobium sp.]